MQPGDDDALREWQHDIPTRYYATYEALEDAFRRRVAGLVPRYHAGTRVFWDDFQQIYDRPAAASSDVCDAYITSNPRDCLAFGTTFQVLQGAWLSASRRTVCPLDEPARVAERFGLADHLQQSIRSLSGGETVRLAMAKAYLLAACASRLTVASPFSWLAREHWGDFQQLADRYRSCGAEVELLALEGEDAVDPVAAEAESPPPLTFAWRLKALQLDLGSLLDHLHDRPVRATVAPVEDALMSPCLFWGDNGQGKSLVAKALAGAIPLQGEASVLGQEGPRRARLLFQDVLNQTLMRSMRRLIPRPRADEAAVTYDELRAGVQRRVPPSATQLPPFAERQKDPAPLHLLEIKILLAAVRLIDRRTALILDEPDWGLSRTHAVAYVTAVVHAAHDRGVPVILISHKPWWRHLAQSVRRFRKETAAPGREGRLFDIRIDPLTGGLS